MLLATSTSMIPTSVLDAEILWRLDGSKDREHADRRRPTNGLRLARDQHQSGLGQPCSARFPSGRANGESFLSSEVLAGNDSRRRWRGILNQAWPCSSCPSCRLRETSGLGCGLTVLLLALGGEKKIRHRELISEKNYSRWGHLCRWELGRGWVCSCCALGHLRPPRVICCHFYLLLAAPIMAGPVGGTDFSGRARGAARLYIIFVLAGLLLVLSPQRPLWPASTVFNPRWTRKHSKKKKAPSETARGAVLFRLWHARKGNSFRPGGWRRCRRTPTHWGLVTFDDPEAALWRPFGSRRILHITGGRFAGGDPRDGASNMRWSVRTVSGAPCGHGSGQLASRHFHAEKMAEFKLRIHAGQETGKAGFSHGSNKHYG